MLTFFKCVELLGSKSEKKIDHNTYLVPMDSNTIGVKFHRTIIISIHSDNTFTLRNCGFTTSTTKQRINKYSPARVYQSKFEWFIGEIEFFDGIKVDSSGNVIK